MITAGIAQCTSTTQRGEGRPTTPRTVLSMPQFGSKMKYHTTATAAPESTVGVKMMVRAALRKRSPWFSSRAKDKPSTSVRPTEPTMKVAVLSVMLQKRGLVRTVTQLVSPTKRLTGEIMSHSVKLSVTFWISGQYAKTDSSSRLGATKATNVSHSRHSRVECAVRAESAARVAELTSLAFRIVARARALWF